MKIKYIHKAVPLLLAFFLLISFCQVSALKQTQYFGSSVSTVKTPQVTLDIGTKGSMSLSTTNDYGSVVATSGYKFYENASAPSSYALAIDGETSGSANAASVTTGTLDNKQAKRRNLLNSRHRQQHNQRFFNHQHRREPFLDSERHGNL